MRKDCGLKMRDLKIDGGATANDFLCQFQSDILGINVVRPQGVETTACGAAYLAGLSVGFWKSTAQIKKNWKKGKIFEPKISKKDSSVLYANWLKAVKRTLSNPESVS
jgi:glycerol kinase